MFDKGSTLIEKLPSQTLFLFWRDLCGSTNVYSAVKILLPGLQQREFEVAFGDLLFNHFELNSYFDDVDQNYSDYTYRLDLNPKSLSNFTYVDIRASDDAENQIKKLKEDALHRTFDIRGLGGYFLKVMRLRDDEYFILFCSEHMLLDGLGVDFILAKYLKALHADKSSVDMENSVLLDSLSKYNNAIRFYNSNNIESLKSNDFYVKYMEKINSSRFFWAPEGRDLTNTKGKYLSIGLTIDQVMLSRVRGLAGEYNASLYTCLLFIFCQALYRTDEKLTQTLIQIPTHGKAINHQVIPTEIAGCFAQAFVMSIERNIVEEDPLHAIDYIKTHSELCQIFQIDQINARVTAESLSSNKNLKSRLKEDDSFALLVRKNMQTNIYFSFFGNSAIDSAEQPYAMCGYDFGTTNLGGALDVMAISVGGLINLSFNYDSIYFSSDTIKRLVNTFIDVVNEITIPASKTRSGKSIVSSGSEGDLSWAIEVINKFSIEPVMIGNTEFLLEIDLGIDSLAKTRLIAELEKVACGYGFKFERREIFSAQTVYDILSALIKIG